MNRTIAVILFFAPMHVMHAQDSLDVRHLDEVVVTGQYASQSASNSVYDVRVITAQDISSRGATKLEDVLNTQLNMRFSQDGATGGSRLSMQGLSGQNIKILLDGVPMAGRQGVLNEIDINQINVHTVERIEIVEGPMSTMYGSDALAGVINIITKKSNSNEWDLTASILEKSVGSEYSLKQGIHNQSLGGSYARKKWYIAADLAKNYFGGWQGQAAGRDKAWHPKDQIMASARMGFTPSEGEIYYRLDYLYENLYNPGPVQVDKAQDEEYITHRFMHQLQGEYSLSGRLRFSGFVAYTDYSRRKRAIVVEAASGKETLALGAGTQTETTLDGIAARGTFIYNTAKNIALQAGVDVNVMYGKGERISSNGGIGDYALFASVEWRPRQNIKLRPGLRTTYNSVYKAPPVAPSLNFKWALTDRHTLRLSYGYGFRAPSLRELYFNFFDTNHAIRGNPALKAEHSHSAKGTWDWKAIDNDPLQIAVTLGGFYNAVYNRIDFGQKIGSRDLTYINIGEYRTYGVNLRTTLTIPRFEMGAGFSYIHTLFWTPEFVSRLAYNIPRAHLLFSFYYKYTGQTLLYSIGNDTPDSEPVKTEGFHTADVTVTKTCFKRFTLSAGVHNIFGVTLVNNLFPGAATSGTHGAGATTPIGYGRSYFFGISYTLDHEFGRIRKKVNHTKPNNL